MSYPRTNQRGLILLWVLVVQAMATSLSLLMVGEVWMQQKMLGHFWQGAITQAQANDQVAKVVMLLNQDPMSLPRSSALALGISPADCALANWSLKQPGVVPWHPLTVENDLTVRFWLVSWPPPYCRGQSSEGEALTVLMEGLVADRIRFQTRAMISGPPYQVTYRWHH